MYKKYIIYKLNIYDTFLFFICIDSKFSFSVKRIVINIHAVRIPPDNLMHSENLHSGYIKLLQ